MIPSLSPSDQKFLNRMNRISDRLNKAQERVSSGSRFTSVSDDPDQVSTLLQARASLSSVHQIQSNLGRVKAEVDAGEQALRTVADVFERARVLGAQGANFTQDADTRASIAGELGALLQQVVGLASTQVEGRYIFSGDTDQVIPFTIDLSQADPVSAYQGAAATRVVQHPNGTTFDVSHAGDDIFDSADPTTNFFGTINAVRTALLANDPDAILTAVDGLAAAGRHLNAHLAFYGTTQNRVAEANLFGQTLELQLKTEIGNLQDADLTEAILELNSASTQQQAALSARAQVPRKSLFDYIG